MRQDDLAPALWQDFTNQRLPDNREVLLARLDPSCPPQLTEIEKIRKHHGQG